MAACAGRALALAVGIADFKATGNLLDSPGWRESSFVHSFRRKKRELGPLGHAPPDIPPFFPSRLRAVSFVNRVSDHGECRALGIPPIIKFAPLRKRHTDFGSLIKKSTQPARLGAQKRIKRVRREGKADA